MDQIIPVINAIIKGVKNPYLSAVGALCCILLYLFVLVQKGKFRDNKAEREKDEQKGESNIETENRNAEGDTSVRDRLNRRDNP